MWFTLGFDIALSPRNIWKKRLTKFWSFKSTAPIIRFICNSALSTTAYLVSEVLSKKWNTTSSHVYILTDKNLITPIFNYF